jgi:hypothetical protein
MINTQKHILDNGKKRAYSQVTTDLTLAIIIRIYKNFINLLNDVYESLISIDPYA